MASPDSILGLPSSDKFAAAGDRFFNHRRKILHHYPRGGVTLTGLLSLMPTEDVNDAIFYWYESFYTPPHTKMRGTNPVTTTSPGTGDSDDGTAVTAGAKNITTDFFIKVSNVRDLKPFQVLDLTTDRSVQVWITAVTPGVADPNRNGFIKVRLIRAATFTLANFVAGARMNVVGTAYGEGSTGVTVKPTPYKRPFRVENTTQIFRDAMTFPGSALKMGLKYDKSGVYQEKARQTLVEHMVGIEKALFFGKRATTSRDMGDPAIGENLSVRQMSGILEFLELWDAGSAGLQIDGQTFAPYAFKEPSLTDADDLKRIVANSSGDINYKQWDIWTERVSRTGNLKTGDRLVVCGSGAIIAMMDMFRSSSRYNIEYGVKLYGLDFHTLKTPFGDYHFTTHPLWNIDPVMSYWALILDVQSLKLRPLLDRDTKCLKNRQNNGDDLRKDEYLTELGLEFWNPSGHMLIQNVRQYRA